MGRVSGVGMVGWGVILRTAASPSLEERGHGFWTASTSGPGLGTHILSKVLSYSHPHSCSPTFQICLDVVWAVSSLFVL